MINKDENKILNLIKIGPVFVVIFSILIIFIMLENNNQNFENEIKKLSTDSLHSKKELIKNEIDKVLSLIETEKQLRISRLKKNIKQRVYIAHTIATSIYNENKDKSDNQIKKMIKDALRNVRFYDNRGYFFIYDMKGTNVLHPILTNLEKKNLLHFKDTKGKYLIKEIIDIVKEKKEGFLTWWWNKPNDKNTQYEKIGFNKYFEPFDWFIGTGEYVLDYESQLKKELLEKIQKIRYGKNGYIFIGNYDGINLSHINKKIIGTSILHLKDENGFMLVQEIIKVAKNGGGYLMYGGITMPSTGIINHKISYVKGLEDWKWAIGTGVYADELEELIDKKRIRLKQRNKQQITETIFISTVTFVVIFLVSIFFARNIQNRFKAYKYKVEEKTIELNTLNNKLEDKVKERTIDLEKINKTLEQKVEERTKSLKELVIRDPLTNIYNRRYFGEVSQELFLLSKRNHTYLSILMIDIDKFKNINDTYGHDIGDEVIKLLAEILTKHVRSSDVVSRLGGDEFAVILPGTNVNDAKNKAEEIRKEIESVIVNLENKTTLNFTISIGVSTLNFKLDSSFETILKKSDKALYEAKESARNKVIVKI